MAAGGAFADGGDRGGEGMAMEQLARQLEIELDLIEFFQEIPDELRIELSAGARLLLLVPLAEVKNEIIRNWSFLLSWDRELVRDFVEPSLRELLTEMAESPAADDRRTEQRESPSPTASRPRSSLSAIKAFWRRFCNIPPFCGESEQ